MELKAKGFLWRNLKRKERENLDITTWRPLIWNSKNISCNGSYRISTCRLFSSWGWKNIQPMKSMQYLCLSPLLSKIIDKRKSKTNEIILVGTQVRLTNDKLASRIQSEEAQRYRIEKINFINALNDKKDLVYRSYFSEVDITQKENFLKKNIQK